METTNEQKSPETPDEKSTPVEVVKRGFNRPAVFSGLGFAILIAIVTFWGIHARSVSDATLAKETRAAAIPSVDVVHPSLGTTPYEVVLPASVQGFIDSPVYARTTGYLHLCYPDTLT